MKQKHMTKDMRERIEKGIMEGESLKDIAKAIDKDLIYFVIGDGELTNPPLRPELFLKSSIEYKIRKSAFTTQFGVAIKP